MGRKPYASKLLEKASVPESTNPSLEKSELLPKNSKPSLNRVGSQLGNQNPPSSILNCPKSSMEGMVLQNERSSAEAQENTKSELQEKSYAYRRKKSKHSTASVRRSERVKTTVFHASSHDIEPYVEDITVIDNEKDEPDAQTDKELSKPETNLGETSLEEKVDYILQRLKALEKTVESLEPKHVEQNAASDETLSSASIVYRNLYLESQKKLEALTDDNWQLTGKLENALGKIEVMEKQSNILLEVLGKVKDVLLISSMTKSNEATVHATQAIQNACAGSDSKRKRQDHEN